MRIGFDFRMGGSVNSGIGRYVFELLTHILEQDRVNQYVIFYHPLNSAPADIEKLKKFTNTELVPAPYRHYSLSEQVFFPRLLKKHNLDLVHFPNFNVPVFYRKPFVVTIHDMVHHKISGHKKSHLLHFYGYKYVINQAAHKSQAIITVSEAAKKDIVELLGVPKEKVKVIYEAPFLPVAADLDTEAIKKTLPDQQALFFLCGHAGKKKKCYRVSKGFSEVFG
jgi:glycosyltransferase involved in cell wall biosynthesis